ncbi:MAG: beta-propeller domain-containing protein, partial [Nitrospirota bacterium]|nr:beta-propeller domain-containing protein [Nitrospirota bacterium]
LDELKEFLEQNSANSYGVYGRGGMLTEMATDAINAPAATMKSEESAQSVSPWGEESAGEAGLGAGSQDYSKTNVQVEGVDEPDIIKTDGKYVYAVVNENLFIVEARPAEEAQILSKITFKSRPQDIYVNGDSLIVFGQDNLTYNAEVYKEFKRRGSFTFFKVFDITDKKNPKQARDLDFEGDYSNSRMIGDYVYFVTVNFNYNYYDDEMPTPRMIENGKAVSVDCVSNKAGCVIPDVYYFDIPYESYNFTSVNAINIKKHDQKVMGDIYLLSGNQNMYVSQNNIYITYTKYINEYQLMMEVMKEAVYPRLSAKDQEKIAKIEATENYILNQAEKMAKIGRIIERYQASLSPEELEKLTKETEKKMKQKYQDISKELEKTVIH